MSNELRPGLKEKALKSTKKLLVVVVYLWVLLTVFQLHRAIILGEYGIEYNYAQGLLFALINAWVLGKFVLIGEGMRIGESWQRKPLLHSILFKAGIFAAILMIFHILEGALGRMWRAKGLAAGLPNLGGTALVDGLSLAVIVFVVLIPFFAAREFSRVLGKDEFQSLLWRQGNAAAASSRSL